ncbi:hypothetical protein CEXT_260561 [Caerostris extrusa]|uniref:Uncharacterized protein n=1 Tax=Caerostris extrusa TaxID=172846 RepID=A0AAV4UFJ0_CAEEX|nr:hypothetical protein CEXT_260561 [Caerostris extrusa]
MCQELLTLLDCKKLKQGVTAPFSATASNPQPRKRKTHFIIGKKEEMFQKKKMQYSEMSTVSERAFLKGRAENIFVLEMIQEPEALKQC